MSRDQETFFNSLVADYSERLYWHVRSLVGSHEDADDLMQDIYIKVWQALPRFRGDSAPFTWLWRIATNETLSFLRKKRVRAFFSPESLGPESGKVAGDAAPFPGDEAERKLAAAIEALPDRQRSVFCMRYYEDLSYEDISRITGTSVGALKASYHFAQQKVKDYLSETD